jgi:hypothetical protein
MNKNEDKNLNLLTYMLFAVFIAIILAASWESYLNYLNRKLIIEAIKDQDSKYTNDQMQGLINNIKK